MHKHIKQIFLFYIVCILLLITLPLNGTDSFLSNNYLVQIRLDYLGHVFLFLPILFLFIRAFSVNIFLAILLGMFFAAFMEGLQYILPYRSFNINDLLSNMMGILFGLLLFIPGISRVLKKYL